MPNYFRPKLKTDTNFEKENWNNISNADTKDIIQLIIDINIDDKDVILTKESKKSQKESKSHTINKNINIEKSELNKSKEFKVQRFK